MISKERPDFGDYVGLQRPKMSVAGNLNIFNFVPPLPVEVTRLANFLNLRIAIVSPCALRIAYFCSILRLLNAKNPSPSEWAAIAAMLSGRAEATRCRKKAPFDMPVK
jgi:hypothetical protein